MSSHVSWVAGPDSLVREEERAGGGGVRAGLKRWLSEGGATQPAREGGGEGGREREGGREGGREEGGREASLAFP